MAGICAREQKSATSPTIAPLLNFPPELQLFAVLACLVMSSSSSKLRSVPDRIRQVAMFETGGLLLITPPFIWLSGVAVVDSFVLLAMVALIAAVWNAAYNTGFDWLEHRLTGRAADQRPLKLRILHATGFETGLLLVSLPIIAAWTGMGWWEVLIADIGLAVAYTVYAFFFNIAYDKWFPITAQS